MGRHALDATTIAARTDDRGTWLEARHETGGCPTLSTTSRAHSPPLDVDGDLPGRRARAAESGLRGAARAACVRRRALLRRPGRGRRRDAACLCCPHTGRADFLFVESEVRGSSPRLALFVGNTLLDQLHDPRVSFIAPGR